MNTNEIPDTIATLCRKASKALGTDFTPYCHLGEWGGTYEDDSEALGAVYFADECDLRAAVELFAREPDAYSSWCQATTGVRIDLGPEPDPRETHLVAITPHHPSDMPFARPKDCDYTLLDLRDQDEVLVYLREWYQDDDDCALRELARLLRSGCPSALETTFGKLAAYVDGDAGVTDQWPTTGYWDGFGDPAWGNDVRAGLADYLCSLEWWRLTGQTPNYTLAPEDVAADPDAIEDAIDALPEGDPIRAVLVARLAQLAKEVRS